MDEFGIKHEFHRDLQTQCRTCLSVGRKLLPLAQYHDIYKKITSEFDAPDGVCWECHALLKRVVQFRCQVMRAAELLNLQQNFLYGTFSSLTTVTLNDKHPHTIYVCKSNIETDMKVEESTELKYDNCPGDTFDDGDMNETCLEHSINDLKTEIECGRDSKSVKQTNRWAKKRAIQNKKPKFKIVTEHNAIFKEVWLKNEELCRSREKKVESMCYISKKYKCEDCILGFKREESLMAHNEKCHVQGTGPLICDICQRRFRDKRHLTTHISKHYYKYECVICRLTSFDKNQINSHIQNEHASIMQCLKCKLMFCNRREFFDHYKESHEKFVCDYCGIAFKMRYCIKDHIRKQHSPFECKPCNKTFARYNGLWLHKKLRHSPAGQSAYCVECDKKYVDIYRYRWHLANSAKHKPRQKLRIPCPNCDKVFSKNIYMKDHYNLVHLKQIKYRCEECDKNFIRNADLVKHKRRIHEGILPPKNKICYMCGRGFTTNKILTNHLRTHTGELPFACRSCSQRFAQRSALVSHTRAVHKRDQLII